MFVYYRNNSNINNNNVTSVVTNITNNDTITADANPIPAASVNTSNSLTNTGAAKIEEISRKKINKEIDELIKDNLLKEELIINEIKTTASTKVTGMATTPTTTATTTNKLGESNAENIGEQTPASMNTTPVTTASSVPHRLKQQTGSISKFLLNDSNSFNNTTTNTDMLSISSSSSFATTTHNAYLNGHNSHGAGSTSGISSSYISDTSGVDLSMDSVVERFNEE